ncbi:MAG: hypothetical protein ABS92_03910 [Thiobacillus sp. SCN 63-374]|nr:MAG: hypothetical protein ABS92_03910 [Thiobacillus sp. SCN 63-374]
MDKTTVFTVGHSTHPIEAFIALLKQHGITALADVRSAPYSRFNAQFNKDALERVLKEQGIKYVFVGKELGARSEDPSCYKNGRVRYPLLARTALFRQGIERVLKGSQDYRIALMCAEKEPLECHRTLLVARALDDMGVPIQHILADGHLEPHGEAMLRLLDLVGLPREDLFRSREELLADALARQEEKVAYVDEKLATEAGPAT